MLYNIYKLKSHLLLCGAVSQVLSQGRDQALSSRLMLLCQGCLSVCRVHSLLTFLHVCVQEQIFPSICLSCENRIALLWLPCILDALVTSLVCRRSPWLMPALLDVLVGALVGEGLCPLGEGLCLPVGACMPTRSVWALCAHRIMTVPFVSFTVRVMPMCHLHKTLSSSPSFCQECINVFLCYLGMPIHTVPRYLPSKEKKLWLTWNCP